MARVNWNSREADRILRSSGGPVSLEMRAKAHRVEAEQKRLCAVDTGATRNSIHVREGRDEAGSFWEVGSDLETALWLELGTRPHVIRPKDKQALSWPGGEHPVKEVHHPGTKAQPFIRPSVEILRNDR